MATPAGNPGNGGKYKVMVDQIDSSSDGMGGGPYSLERDYVLQSPNDTGYAMFRDFSVDTPSADPAVYSTDM